MLVRFSRIAAAVAAIGACAVVGPAAPANGELHRRLLELLSRYNVNDYAASVRVLAAKP